MSSTLIALVMAPALVGLATVAAARWDERAGGVVSAFPAIVGPVLLIVALRHGPAFAARAANGTLLGLVSLAAFALAYGRVARRCGWRASLLAGWVWAGLAGAAVGLAAGGAGSPAGLLVATAALASARRALPPAGVGHGAAVRDGVVAVGGAAVRGGGAAVGGGGAAGGGAAELPRWGVLALRMATAVLLVAALSAAAGAVGPLAGGMLTALPVLACVLAVFTHRDAGAVAVIGLLRGMLAGMASFVVFCQLIAMLTRPYGVAPAFGAATVGALLVQALTVYSVHSTLRRQSSAARPGVAAAAGSLRRQSS